jgi:hypothetical protein
MPYGRKWNRLYASRPFARRRRDSAGPLIREIRSSPYAPLERSGDEGRWRSYD